ncbi:MAG: hypothetical protein P1S46_10230 [bacterium]|nr:hypothetical protein [bacterium]MDT8396540.1 hypothetical protein [bacterium]
MPAHNARASFSGVLGLSIGLAGAYALGSMMGISVVPDPSFIPVAVLFSSLVGVFFGFYPARKAARIDPIEALRYE